MSPMEADPPRGVETNGVGRRCTSHLNLSRPLSETSLFYGWKPGGKAGKSETYIQSELRRAAREWAAKLLGSGK